MSEQIFIDPDLIMRQINRMEQALKIYEDQIKRYENIARKVDGFTWEKEVKKSYENFMNKDIEVLNKVVVFYKESMIYLKNVVDEYIQMDERLSQALDGKIDRGADGLPYIDPQTRSMQESVIRSKKK